MKSYFITDPKYVSQEPETFHEKLQSILSKNHPDFALYRDKNNPHYEAMAERFVDICSKFTDTKALIHGDAALAAGLKAYGVHLTSQQFDEIAQAKSLGLFVIVSCHSEAEIREAEEKGADAVTYSPIFSTPGKGEPKGLEDLQHIVDKISLPIIALGGITTPEQVEAVEKCGVYGFASIRYFIDN